MEALGLHELVFAGIMKCPIDIRAELFANIVLSGGGSMYPNMKERLDSELRLLVPESIKLNILTPTERRYAAWVRFRIRHPRGTNFWGSRCRTAAPCTALFRPWNLNGLLESIMMKWAPQLRIASRCE